MVLARAQAQERQVARSKVLQAVAGPALAPAQALAPTVATVADALQQLPKQAAAVQQAQQPAQAGQAAGTPSGLTPISSLVSQAGGLLQQYLPNLGRRLLRA